MSGIEIRKTLAPGVRGIQDGGRVAFKQFYAGVLKISDGRDRGDADD